jgi:hypothetical protein
MDTLGAKLLLASMLQSVQQTLLFMEFTTLRCCWLLRNERLLAAAAATAAGKGQLKEASAASPTQNVPTLKQ